jgi:hypothetical protein
MTVDFVLFLEKVPGAIDANNFAGRQAAESFNDCESVAGDRAAEALE